MSLARVRTVFANEASHNLTRPLFWFLLVLLALMSWLFSTGNMRISTGDATVGGTQAWITSEFNFAFFLAMIVALIYSFYGSIAAGLAIPSDDDWKVGDLLHSTPLRPSEYVWGKFLAVLFSFFVALAAHLVFTIFFYHLVPNDKAAEIRGPFDLINYLRPALVFGVPTLVFVLGVAFFLGERLRRPLAVFLFPVGLLLLSGFFLWSWSPGWLDPAVNRALMLVDPAGFRWLNETWIKLDRGARFYNTARIGLDLPFVLSRAAFFGIGLLGVVLAERHLSAVLQGQTAASPRRLRRQRTEAAAAEAPTQIRTGLDLASLGMRIRRPGLFQGAFQVAGTELRNLLSSPALYLFMALILVQTIGNSLVTVGPFDTDLLLTSGQIAANAGNILNTLLCLLLMFYTVESIERDRGTGLAAVSYASPIRTGSLLLGKGLANSAVGLLMIAATFVGCAAAILIDGKTAVDPVPFLLVWGLLVLPTVILWTAFITAVQSLTQQRYTTYGVGLAVLGLTFYRVQTGKMTWLGNWPLWNAITWTDMGSLERDARALLLSRLLALGLAAFFTVIAVRAYSRRQADAIQSIHRLQPHSLRRQVLRLAPFAVIPALCGSLLWIEVRDGVQGSLQEKKDREYWKQNLATWKDAPRPSLAGVDLDLRIDPQRHWLHSRGSYELVNDRAVPLRQIALTGGRHWENVRWTMNGRPYEPEDRSRLYVFTPPAPLPPGGRMRIGFDFTGTFLAGMTKNGGKTQEFILPSGIVLTNFTPSFAPLAGYDDRIGRKKDENDYEPRIYPDDFYIGQTDVAFGASRAFNTRVAVTGPADYRFNSVGSLVSDRVKGGERTMVWQSDHPVRIFNVVGGRWKERRGQGTAIYYHPGHGYNIEAMSTALDAARKYYSEWFYPFPWKDLKLSEFPTYATYAQGFPTNITFSEGIGFLTKPEVKADTVLLVTAHEAAHQWWGNILTPGEGPGGDILSEGMSHFSTMLLIEQLRGRQARMEFAKGIEERYGDRRRVDSERPLVKIDSTREGDETAVYDKGGWAAWMMERQLGRERMLAGLRHFIAERHDGPDYPVLQDFVTAMRPYAPDPAAYDGLVKQWYFDVVVPEYQLAEAKRTKAGASWEVTVKVKNIGTGRMPVAVAAIRGERFTEGGKPDSDYRDARSTVVLGAGEEKLVRIACPFEPEKVVVDPDVEVLQLRRKAAVAKL